MIKVFFSTKRKQGENKESLGKITSIGLYFVDQPKIRKGVTRLTSLKLDTFHRLKNNQLVLTDDGLGFIKDYAAKDSDDKPISMVGVNVQIRNLGKTKVFYNLGNIRVIDIIDAKSGIKYPAIETDYPYLIVDDMPVKFVTDNNNKAILSVSSRKKLEEVKIFTKKSNGIKILTTLTEKGIWKPGEK